MDNSLSLCKKIMKQELAPYEFSLFQRTFFRVINDVMQKIYINKDHYGCSIEYGILPLALCIDKPSFLHGGRYVIDIAWVIPKDKIHLINLVNQIPQKLHYDVLPFFERATDISSAYSEIINLEISQFKHVYMNDINKVYLCIKNNDYQNAYKHMEAIVRQNEDAIQQNISMFEKMGDMKRLEEYKAKFIPLLDSNKEELRRISIHDDEYYRNLFLKNEEKSRDFLRNIT